MAEQQQSPDDLLPPEVRASVDAAAAASRDVRIAGDRFKKLGIAYIMLVVTIVGIYTVQTNSSTNDIASAIRGTQVTNAPKVDEAKAAAEHAAAAAEQAQRAAQSSAALLKIVQDCQTPGTPCNRKNAATLDHALKEIARFQLYVGLCLNNPSIPQNTPAQAACVDQMVKEHGLG